MSRIVTMHPHHFARTLATLIASLTLAACGSGSGTADTEVQDMADMAAASTGGVTSDTTLVGGTGEAAHIAGSASDTTGAPGPGQKGGGGSGGGGIKGVSLVADAGVRSMTLTWSDNRAKQYNVYLSSSPNCDISNYSVCPDGRMLVNVRSPYKVGELVNGRVYYAQIEGIHRNAVSLSNEAGARPTTLEFNYSVSAIASAADGTTYLGGDFTRIGLTSGQAAALDALSGRPSVPGFAIVGDGGVTAAVPDGAGGWYIGGDFKRVGAVAKTFLAHLHADGTLDTSWAPVPSAPVNTMALMNGVLYIGGTFTTINGQQRVSLAALDAASGQLMAWNPSPNLGVWTIAAQNGTIYIGGTFTAVGGFLRNHLAAIDTLGNVLPWNPDADGTVATLALSGSTVYAGGFFDNVSGQRRTRIAAIDAASGSPTAWNASLNCVGCEVRTIAVAGRTLYVGGRFPEIGGVARKSLAAVDAVTGSVLPWNPGADDSVRSLAVISGQTGGTTIYAGGDFTTIGGQPRAYLAALDATGVVLPWQPGPTASVDVVVTTGNHVLAGGRFTGLSAVARDRLAAIDSTGALKAWNPRANGPVLALAVSGEAIYAGGSFTSIGGQPHGRLAKLDAQGNVDPWLPDFDRPVLTLAVGGAGTLYVGGEFRYMNGTPRNRLAAFAASGELLGWAPNADHEVHALALGPDLGFGETVYLGGRFGAINGVRRQRIGQVDAGIGLPTAWNPSGSISEQAVVHALRYANGMIYAGGFFAGSIGVNLAQITEAGTVVPFPGTNSPVRSLALSGRTLTFGGEFTQVLHPVGPTARNRLAAIDVVTRALTAWNPNIGDGGVYSVASDGAGNVHAGGSFTQVGGHVVSGFATLEQ